MGDVIQKPFSRMAISSFRKRKTFLEVYSYRAIRHFCGFSIDHVWERAVCRGMSKPCRLIYLFLYGYRDSWRKCAVTTPFLSALGKTGRGVGVGVGDQWVKPGDGSWEITWFSSDLFSREFSRDPSTFRTVSSSYSHGFNASMATQKPTCAIVV